MGIKSFLAKQAVAFAKPYIKAEITVDNIAGYACEGIDWAATAVTAKVDDARLADIAKGCNLGASVFGNVAAAIDPDSDGGRTITAQEKEPIKENLRTAVTLVVTQEQLDAIVENACAKVLAKLG